VRARPCSLAHPRSPPPAARVTMLVTRLSGWELGMVVGHFCLLCFIFKISIDLRIDDGQKHGLQTALI
jgi:hypothetical protein